MFQNETNIRKKYSDQWGIDLKINTFSVLNQAIVILDLNEVYIMRLKPFELTLSNHKKNNQKKTFVTLEPIPEAKQKIRGGKPVRSPIKVFKNNLKLNFSSTFLSSKSQSKHLNNDQSI